MANSGSRSNQNNRSNQLNPNNPAYQSSREGSGGSEPALDNSSDQLNPNPVPSKPEPSSGSNDQGAT